MLLPCLFLVRMMMMTFERLKGQVGWHCALDGVWEVGNAHYEGKRLPDSGRRQKNGQGSGQGMGSWNFR